MVPAASQLSFNPQAQGCSCVKPCWSLGLPRAWLQSQACTLTSWCAQADLQEGG